MPEITYIVPEYTIPAETVEGALRALESQPDKDYLAQMLGLTQAPEPTRMRLCRYGHAMHQTVSYGTTEWRCYECSPRRKRSKR